MATIPIVNTVDKRIGIISAIALLLITFIVLWFLTYEMPDPLPEDPVVPAVAMIKEIELKELKVVESGGSGGGGTPNKADDPVTKPQTQQSITQNTKPRPTQTTTGGQANSTNAQNSQNQSSGGQPDNPFGPGGSGGGDGGGNGTGVGTHDGSSGTGTGPGVGSGKGRTRLNNVDVNNISIETDASIYYKLTVDAEGNVVSYSNLKSKTTTTNQTLINKIGVAIKKQVKYSKAPGSPLVYQFYTIHVKAT
jgi:hypothetical protein